MGSFDDAWLDRCASERGLGRTRVEDVDDPPLTRRTVEDFSRFVSSLFVPDSMAREWRSSVEEDCKLRMRGSVRLVMVLSKAAAAIASKPTGFWDRGQLC